MSKSKRILAAWAGCAGLLLVNLVAASAPPTAFEPAPAPVPVPVPVPQEAERAPARQAGGAGEAKPVVAAGAVSAPVPSPVEVQVPVPVPAPAPTPAAALKGSAKPELARAQPPAFTPPGAAPAPLAASAPSEGEGTPPAPPGGPASPPVPAHGAEPSPAEVNLGVADSAANKAESATNLKLAAASAKLMRARSFRLNQQWAQAIPLYEAFIAENRESIDLPYALLELGRTYAQLGATEAALTRFYMVLDMAVYVDSPSILQAREVSYSAQYDIAQIQMVLGNYGQAARLFRGMHKLPLKEVDLANIYLNCARALKLSGDKFGASNEYRALLELFTAPTVLAEARFELAVLYAELGRRDEALQQVLAFFERQKKSGMPDETWRYWQRRAGNQLANMFYTAGNLPEAAELYGKLLQLSTETRWRWPLLYQVGLVAEQMKDLAKAKAVFTELAGAKAEGLSSEVAELPKLAQWRLEHLNWSERIDTELKSLKPEA